jgi:hypothetical protein
MNTIAYVFLAIMWHGFIQIELCAYEGRKPVVTTLLGIAIAIVFVLDHIGSTSLRTLAGE